MHAHTHTNTQPTLKAGTHRPNHWTSEALGETRTRSATNIFVCSAVSEAFGAARTVSDPIQHAKSEEVGCQPSEPSDTLIGGLLANQHGVWEGQNTVCALVFYVLQHLLFSCFGVLA